MKIINKDEYGWKIGECNSKIHIRWRNHALLRWYGIRFFEKYNEICFGRLTIRIWKPKFLRDGIYIFREIERNNNFE